MTQRSSDQNRRLWASLQDLATQVKHPQAGTLRKEVWKALFVEQLHQEVDWYQSIDGQRMVPLGYSSSQLTKQQFSDLLHLIYAYGSEKGVQWSDPEFISQGEQARAA